MIRNRLKQTISARGRFGLLHMLIIEEPWSEGERKMIELVLTCYIYTPIYIYYYIFLRLKSRSMTS